MSGNVQRVFETAELVAESSPSKMQSINEIKDLSDIPLQIGKQKYPLVQEVFSQKVALGIISSKKSIRQVCLSEILNKFESKIGGGQFAQNDSILKACAYVLSQTLGDKVLIIFNKAHSLFSKIISNSQVEQNGIQIFAQMMIECDLITKLLRKAEQNVQLMKKVKQSLLDLCFHPKIGPGYVCSFLNSRLSYHNKFYKNIVNNVESQESKHQQGNITPIHSSQNVNGLLRCFQILFQVISRSKLSKTGPLSMGPLLKLIVPGLLHQNSKQIRDVCTKLLCEIHKKIQINFNKVQKLGVKQPLLTQLKTKLAQVKTDTIQKPSNQKEMNDFIVDSSNKNFQQDDDDDQDENDYQANNDGDGNTNCKSQNPQKTDYIKVSSGQDLQKKQWTQRQISIRKV